MTTKEETQIFNFRVPSTNLLWRRGLRFALGLGETSDGWRERNGVDDICFCRFFFLFSFNFSFSLFYLFVCFVLFLILFDFIFKHLFVVGLLNRICLKAVCLAGSSETWFFRISLWVSSLSTICFYFSLFSSFLLIFKNFSLLHKSVKILSQYLNKMNNEGRSIIRVIGRTRAHHMMAFGFQYVWMEDFCTSSCVCVGLKVCVKVRLSESVWVWVCSRFFFVNMIFYVSMCMPAHARMCVCVCVCVCIHVCLHV